MLTLQQMALILIDKCAWLKELHHDSGIARGVHEAVHETVHWPSKNFVCLQSLLPELIIKPDILHTLGGIR